MKAGKDSSIDWSKYWQQGHKTSFGSIYSENYEGIIKYTWQKIFTDMGENKVILDLCTGNASLIRLALAEEQQGNTCKYIGVDYANIEVETELTANENVDFYFGVNIETLPFEDESIDIIVSNFGFEYSNIEKSTAEIARLLSPTGEVILVCHHINSVHIQNSIKEQKITDYLLEENGVMNALFELINTLNDDGVNENSEKHRQQLNQNISELITKFGPDMYQHDFVQFLKHVMSIVEHTKKMEIFHNYNEELLAYQARINAMITAALTNKKIKALQYYCQTNGLEIIKEKEISEQNGMVAYQLILQKRL